MHRYQNLTYTIKRNHSAFVRSHFPLSLFTVIPVHTVNVGVGHTHQILWITFRVRRPSVTVSIRYLNERGLRPYAQGFSG